MKNKYYDLNVPSENYAAKIAYAQRMGWSGVCLISASGKDLKSHAEEIKQAQAETGLELTTGALITAGKPEDIQKKARSALECAVDLVLVAGGDEEINRAASECWEVDVLCHPERVSGKDLMDQKFSGIDDVMARFMAERGIALEINLSGLLSCYGTARAQVMGRMRQNIMLAKKYGTPLIITSCAADTFGMRAPQDIVSLGVSLGMDVGLAKKSVTDCPAMLLKKSRDRRSSNVLLAGLEVVSWGSAGQNKEKKLFGWY